MTTDTTEHEPAPVDAPGRRPLTRRGLLLGGGAGAIAVLAAACGGDDEGTASSGDPTTTTTEPAEGDEEGAAPDGGGATGDLAVAQLAASLEVLAVDTYTAALEAAGSGALGAVPPAVATFVTTALEHHEAHLRAWNDVLVAAGETEVTEAPADLKATVDEAFADLEDIQGAAELALLLEQTAAATYLQAIPELLDPAAIDLASSIHPIDMQHVAVLLFVLGEYPVPDTFAQVDMAYEA